MFKPLSISNLLYVFGTFILYLGGVLTILSYFDGFASSFNEVVRRDFTINALVLSISIFVVFMAPLLVLNSMLYKSRAKVQNFELENSKLRSTLRNSELLRLTDIVTDIPNQEQFFVDLAKIVDKISYDSPFQLIFIDLVGFGEINNKYGYSTGDKIIRYFAQSVSETMRRNENIYKMPFDEQPTDSELWQRAYRKHTGGDEFLFLIGGDEVDAVGFLVRLQKRVENELTQYIQNKIINDTEWSLSFSAAIIPVYPNDTKEDVLHRSHEGMRLARQPGSTCRVFWASKTLPDEIEDGWRKKIYQDAADIFKVE